MFQLKAINQLTCSEQELRDFYECTLALWAQEDGKTMTFEKFSAISKDIKQDTHIFDCYLIMKNGKALARLIFQIVQEHDDQDVTIGIINKHLDDAIFSFLDEVITDKFFPRKSWLKTFQPEVREWARGKGYKVVNQFQYFEKKLNHKQISDLEAQGKIPNELFLEILSYPEGAFLDEYVAFMNTCMREMIRNNVRDNLKMTKTHVSNWVASCKRQKIRFTIIALRNATGKMVAMSFGTLTEPNPTVLQQHMTGVQKDYRGQGLGLIAKSVLYSTILKDFPSIESVKTDCFTTNKPMLDIQLKMGFQPTKLSDELVRELPA